VENPYTFMTDFNETVWNVSQDTDQDTVCRTLISYALKDSAKWWFTSSRLNAFPTWDLLLDAFFRKFFPKAKTLDIRNRISNFCQGDQEPFHSYYSRFYLLLDECPHHEFALGQRILIIYNSLNYNTKILLESMHSGEFLAQDEDDCNDALEHLAFTSEEWADNSQPKELVTTASLNQVTQELVEKVMNTLRDSVKHPLSMTLTL